MYKTVLRDVITSKPFVMSRRTTRLIIVILLSTQMYADDARVSKSCRQFPVAEYDRGYACSILSGSTFDGLSGNATALRLFTRGRNFIDWLSISFPSWLPQLELLQLDVTQIRSLPSSAFKRLPSLREVQLFRTVDRSVTTPPTVGVELHIATFDGLSEVRTLILSDLQLTQLSVGVLRGLTNLMVLDLHRNNLTRLPSGTFDQCCKNLTTLSLGMNNVVNLRDVVLANLRNLRSLDVHQNFIVSLRPVDFDSLENLNSINLARNRLVAIERGTFSALRALKELDLSGNGLGAMLDGSAFAGLFRLQSLFLSGNDLEELHSDMFADQIMLQTLVVSSGRISVLPNELFSGLTQLEELDISNNLLLNIGALIFQGLREIKRIRFENNKIREVEASAFSNLYKLEEVSLRKNQLQAIQAEVFGLVNVTVGKRITLDISENPWKCDCNLAWLYPEYTSSNKSSTVRLEMTDRMICSSPLNVVGETVEQVMKHSCHWTDPPRQTGTIELWDVMTLAAEGKTQHPVEARTTEMSDTTTASDGGDEHLFKTKRRQLSDMTPASDGANERLYGIVLPDPTADSAKHRNVTFISILSVTLVLLAVFVVLTIVLIRHATRVQHLYPVEEFEESTRGRLTSCTSVDTDDHPRIGLRAINRISVLYRPEEVS